MKPLYLNHLRNVQLYTLRARPDGIVAGEKDPGCDKINGGHISFLEDVYMLFRELSSITKAIDKVIIKFANTNTLLK